MCMLLKRGLKYLQKKWCRDPLKGSETGESFTWRVYQNGTLTHIIAGTWAFYKAINLPGPKTFHESARNRKSVDAQWRNRLALLMQTWRLTRATVYVVG